MAAVVALGVVVAVSVGGEEGEGVTVTGTVMSSVAVREGEAVGGNEVGVDVVASAGVEVGVAVASGASVAGGGGSSVGGSSVGGSSVVGSGLGVRVGTVCRSSFCSGLAHVTGSRLNATQMASATLIPPRRFRRRKSSPFMR